MGLHQDKDEVSLDPVVSFSIGDACVFRFGNTVNRNRPFTDVDLRSGDLFVFGGPARLAYHGVTKIIPGTAPGRLRADRGPDQHHPAGHRAERLSGPGWRQ